MTRFALVACVGFSGACYEGAIPIDDEASFRNTELNTPHLNGPIFQGPIFQGRVLNGINLNGPIFQGPIFQGPIFQGPIFQGLQLNGPIFQGPIFQGPWLDGSAFTGTVKQDGQVVQLEPEDFVGSEWTIRLTENNKTEDYILRIDAIHQSPEYDDVYTYDFSQRPKLGSASAWKPLCVDSNNAAVPAIPLAHYWNLATGDRIDDPRVFTLACTNAVLAKCVLWGYRPWAEASFCKNADKGKTKHCEDISLQDYHQACTRMARADYCGDGTPWTVEGNAIDVRDLLNPPVQQPTTDWFVEAEWNPDGAYCVNDIRQQVWKAQGQYPACFLKNGKFDKPIIKNNCGSLKNERALMYSTFDMEAQLAKIPQD
ncbi:MAG: pentapeptide repeat-containing protein [Myxococcales bacterium]|nr:pentapeptide repeat-containing protein [Myxococcales bacterium]